MVLKSRITGRAGQPRRPAGRSRVLRLDGGARCGVSFHGDMTVSSIRDPTAEDGHVGAYVPQFAFGRGPRIPIQDRQICELADLERPESVLGVD